MTTNRERTLTEQLVVRVTPDTRRWLEQRSAEAGRSAAQTIRWLLEQERARA
jgi:hypothetical protein